MDFGFALVAAMRDTVFLVFAAAEGSFDLDVGSRQ